MERGLFISAFPYLSVLPSIIACRSGFSLKTGAIFSLIISLPFFVSRCESNLKTIELSPNFQHPSLLTGTPLGVQRQLSLLSGTPSPSESVTMVAGTGVPRSLFFGAQLAIARSTKKNMKITKNLLPCLLIFPLLSRVP